MSPSVSTLLPVEDERRFDSRRGDEEFLAERLWISVSERLGTTTPPSSANRPRDRVWKCFGWQPLR